MQAWDGGGTFPSPEPVLPSVRTETGSRARLHAGSPGEAHVIALRAQTFINRPAAASHGSQQDSELNPSALSTRYPGPAWGQGEGH